MSPNRSDRLIVGVASLAALVMLAQLLAGKATRDALFLSTFGARALPYAMAGAGVVAFAGAFPASRVLARFGPARTMPFLFTASALLFVGEWGVIDAAPRLVAGVLYLHLALASALLVSGFWATLNERFDPHTARPSLARVASFASLGGMLGGLLSERVSVWFGLDTTLLFLGGMHALCALLVASIGRGESFESPPPDEATGEGRGLALLRRTPYLQLMAVASLTLALVDALLDYAIRAGADAAFATGDELIRFFGFYYTAVGVVTFVFQSVLTARIVARFGIGAAMASMPVAVGAAGVMALVLPGMPSVIALRGVGSVLTNSVYRTGFELLYTPLPTRIKRPTKALVDVGGQRLGDVLGGGLILAIIAALGVHASAGVIVAAIGLSVVMAGVLLRLQGAYRAQLARNLRTGEVSLEEMDTLGQLVAATQVKLDRSEILARIHESGAARSATDGTSDPVSDEADASIDTLIAWLGDARRAARAGVALRARGGDAIGPLLGALASSDRPDLVKLLVPGLLQSAPEPRVVEALLATMAGDGFEVRLRSARAALRLVAQHPDLAPGRERVLAALRDELVNPTAPPPRSAAPEGGDRPDSPLIADLSALRVDRRVEHVCTLLALDGGVELMRSVLLALHSDRAAVRGTALEYLEASLPDELRRPLQPVLGLTEATGPLSSRRRRAARHLEIELLRLAQADILAGDEGRRSGE